MTSKPVQLLLVEDDDVDAEGVERALRKRRIANRIIRAVGGMEALEILRGGEGIPPLRRPFMVLLDLNMPRMDGLTFLKELRADPDLRDSIVFVLTTSDADRDKVAAYDANVAGYMLKSRVGEMFVNLIELLEPYWRYIEFPPGHRPSWASSAETPVVESFDLLVVDDNDVDIELVRRCAPKTYRITEAHSGAECRALLDALQPDCVLLDYRLPDEQGLELLSFLAKQGAPVILTTGLKDERVIAEAVRLGAYGCLSKDALSRQTLQEIVDGALQSVGHSARRSA